MSTCTQLVLEILESRPIMPKYLPTHWCHNKAPAFLEAFEVKITNPLKKFVEYSSF